MTKNQKIGIIAAVIIIVLLIIGFVAYQNKQTQDMIKQLTGIAISGSNNNSGSNDTSEATKVTPTPVPNTDHDGHIAKDPQNATYTIEGQQVMLMDGKSEDGNTTMFDTPTVGDLNGDGANDAGVILVVTGNGSGSFYYAAAALNNTSTYTYDGTNAILLGDRIAPQTKDIQDETYTVNFAERADGEPMSTPPSVAVSKNFKVSGSTLSEVSQ